MSFKGARVGIFAAVVLASGAGFGLARVFDPHAPSSGAETGAAHDDHAGDSHEGEQDHVEGFVALKPEDAPAAGVQLAQVERGGGVDLILPGRVAIAVNSQGAIGAPLDGVIAQVHVAAGSRISHGSPIASLRSPEGGAIRAEVDAARAALDAAEALDTRNRNLFDEGALSRQEWEATHAATLAAQAKLRAAQAQAEAMGSPDASGLVVVRSPIAGVVTRVATSPGAVLDDGMEIAVVSDASKSEFVFDAPPASVGLITPGARIAAEWTGGNMVEAEVTGVAPGGAGAWATVRARALGLMPPPGTVISGRLVGGAGNVLTVPSDAVQTITGVPSVFVVGNGGFRAVAVVAGRTSNGRTEIMSGLNGDELVAGSGAFLLKAELGKGQAEHDH